MIKCYSELLGKSRLLAISTMLLAGCTGTDREVSSNSGAEGWRCLLHHLGYSDERIVTERPSPPHVFELLNAVAREAKNGVHKVSVRQGYRLLCKGDEEGFLVIRNPGDSIGILFGVSRRNGDSGALALSPTGSLTFVPESRIFQISGIACWFVPFLLDREVLVPVGSGGMAIDRLWSYFGDVAPDSTPSAVFRVVNRSEDPICLSKPSTTCGCTTVDVIENVDVAPGESKCLTVKVKAGERKSISEKVTFRLLSTRHSGDGRLKASRPITLSIYGATKECFAFEPKRLNFGVLSPEVPVVDRVLVFKEATSDRFIIEEVVGLDVPFDYTISSRQVGRGLNVYSVQLEVRRPSATRKLGNQSGTLLVKTTSKTRPSISIPYTYDLLGHVTARPAHLFFDAHSDVEKGTILHNCYLRQLGSGRMNIRPIVVPDGLNVAVQDAVPLATISITADVSKFTRPVRRDVVLRCSGVDWEEDVVISCAIRPNLQQFGANFRYR